MKKSYITPKIGVLLLKDQNLNFLQNTEKELVTNLAIQGQAADLLFNPVILDHMNIINYTKNTSENKELLEKSQKVVSEFMKKYKVTFRMGDNVYGHKEEEQK